MAIWRFLQVRPLGCPYCDANLPCPYRLIALMIALGIALALLCFLLSVSNYAVAYDRCHSNTLDEQFPPLAPTLLGAFGFAVAGFGYWCINRTPHLALRLWLSC